MEVNIVEIHGNWDLGYVMDKHIVSSECIGHNEYGYPIFNTVRTDVGEAVFQLKYRGDWMKVNPLAQCLYDEAVPLFDNIDLIIPMAASNPRQRQPVTEIANSLAQKMGINSYNNLLFKEQGGPSLKNLQTVEEKEKAVEGAFFYEDKIDGIGPYDVLVIDDLYHTGASMRAACAVLRNYNKINNIYVASLTWR